MTGVMTQWMKDRLARKHEEARRQGWKEGFEIGWKEGFEIGWKEGVGQAWTEDMQGMMEACREDAWARRQGLAPPSSDAEDDPAAP